jgi:ribosomal protein S18 acetylase RimI-like enzyme
MIIRPYTESDLPTLKAITVEAFDGVSVDQNIEARFGRVGGRDWRWRKARHLDWDVAARGAAIFVAENECGEILGYISTRIDREAGIGFIPNMAIRAGLRGQGIGRKLIERALQTFREAGLELAKIETLDQNAVGQHLYPACGFVEVARQIHFAMRL